MRILALNIGSSSFKFRLLDVIEGAGGTLVTGHVAFHGAVRGIGGVATLEMRDARGATRTLRGDVPGHVDGLRWLWENHPELDRDERSRGMACFVDAVGHRVVHGGERFGNPVVIDGIVEAEIEALSKLAPLHNPASLSGIRAARDLLGPAVPMVAVFDTAFHRTLLPEARYYALPRELAERHKIRRYGFHGIAHASLAEGFAAATGQDLAGIRLITLQLGNGCSAAAIEKGVSVETSMGFTPLEGLVMGTRSGDIDASVVGYLAEREGVAPAEVERWLNQRSGLMGVSGRTNDMRELLRAASEERDERAELAIAMFCFRARKYIGAYLAVLGGADAVVFGGGIGEGAPEIRKRICDRMEWSGIRLDAGRNGRTAGLAPGTAARISADGSKIAVYVVAEDEETRIAIETARCLRA